MGCYYHDIRMRLKKLTPELVDENDWQKCVARLTPTELGKIDKDERIREDADLIYLTYGKYMIYVISLKRNTLTPPEAPRHDVRTYH